MAVSAGDLHVLLSSVKICLADVRKTMEKHHFTSDLAGTEAELQSMKSFLETELGIGGNKKKRKAQ